MNNKPTSDQLRMFDAYQHFLFYFEQGRYKEEQPHGANLSQHFSDKLDGLRKRNARKHMIECNSPEVLVKWLQDMTHHNQTVMLEYMMKHHRHEDGRSKWGREFPMTESEKEEAYFKIVDNPDVDETLINGNHGNQ